MEDIHTLLSVKHRVCLRKLKKSFRRYFESYIELLWIWLKLTSLEKLAVPSIICSRTIDYICVQGFRGSGFVGTCITYIFDWTRHVTGLTSLFCQKMLGWSFCISWTVCTNWTSKNKQLFLLFINYTYVSINPLIK